MIEDVTWIDLIKYMLLSCFGFSMAFIIRLGERNSLSDPAAIKYNLRLYAKIGGWILGIGGLLICLRVLNLLLASE